MRFEIFIKATGQTVNRKFRTCDDVRNFASRTADDTKNNVYVRRLNPNGGYLGVTWLFGAL